MFSVKNGQMVKICSAPVQFCGEVEIQLCVPAGLVFVCLHRVLQKHLSHRPGYVVLQPNGRKIHLIDSVSFLFARNSGQISMSSGSECVTAALGFGVWEYLRSLPYAKVSLLYKSDWNIAAQWLKFVNYWARALKLYSCHCHSFCCQVLLLTVIFWKRWPLRGQLCACKTTACLLRSLILCIVGALPTFP